MTARLPPDYAWQVSDQHTAESFSHQQLMNYIEVGKVAAQVRARSRAPREDPMTAR